MPEQSRKTNAPQPKAQEPANKGTLTKSAVKTEASADKIMVQAIDKLKGLHEYGIRNLVQHSESLGQQLVKQGLKTNQIRKFLDEVKRLKVKLDQNRKDETDDLSIIKDEVFMLKPQLAWATARQKTKYGSPVQPFSDVMNAAIDKTYSRRDFYRLVQLMESIIAYHKAAGGKDS